MGLSLVEVSNPSQTMFVTSLITSIDQLLNPHHESVFLASRRTELCTDISTFVLEAKTYNRSSVEEYIKLAKRLNVENHSNVSSAYAQWKEKNAAESKRSRGESSFFSLYAKNYLSRPQTCSEGYESLVKIGKIKHGLVTSNSLKN